MEVVCRQLRKTARAHELALETLPCEPLREDEVRIAPVLVGLCGSDYRVVANCKDHRPGVFGHEVAARVVGVGSAIRDVSIGELVTVNPVDADDDDNIIGYNGEGFLTTNFTLSHHLLRQQRLFRFAAQTRAEDAVFAEPLACCIHAQERIREPLAGARVAIIGSGSFGLLHYLLAKHAGAQVFVTARSRARMEEAVKRGVIPRRDTSLDTARRDACIGTAHVVIVTGNGLDAIEEGIRWASDGATVLLFGGLADSDSLGGIPVGRVRREQGELVGQLAGKRLRFIGSYGTTFRDFKQSVALIDSANLRPGRLITHSVDLAAAAGALAGLATGALGGTPVLKLVVKP